MRTCRSLFPKVADSWGSYNKAQILKLPHQHKNSLPEPVMLVIKKSYKDLANPELLKKCLHGRAQNPNESFNNVVCSKVPKLTFVRLTALKRGVYDAILSFKYGYFSKAAVYKQLGLKVSKQSVHALRRFDVMMWSGKTRKKLEKLLKISSKKLDKNEEARGSFERGRAKKVDPNY